MQDNEIKQDKILSAIGLSRVILAKAPNFKVCDESKFIQYVSSQYRASQRKETDEFYRFFEQTLLHLESGLRVTYSTYENYFGDEVEYKLMNIFIITIAKKQLEVLDGYSAQIDPPIPRQSDPLKLSA